MMHGGEVMYRSVVMLCLSYTSAYSQQIHLIANTIFADLWQRRLIQIWPSTFVFILLFFHLHLCRVMKRARTRAMLGIQRCALSSSLKGPVSTTTSRHQADRVRSGHSAGGEKVNFCLHHHLMNHFSWLHCCLQSPQHKFKKGTTELFPKCVHIYVYQQLYFVREH